MVETKTGDVAAKALFHSILVFFSLLCIIPFVVVLSISFSDENYLLVHGYTMFPRDFSLAGYAFIFKNPGAILSAYWVTIRLTVIGTLAGLAAMSMAAYPLTRKDFRLQRVIRFYVLFTMLFNGGLVPTYIVVTRYLHLADTLPVLFLPDIVNAWYQLLLVAYFKTIPFELIESAKMDGASEFLVYFRIVLPLARPALATIGLLLALQLWNEWFLALLYIDKQSLIPLQYWMQRVMYNMQFLLSNANRFGAATSVASIPTESVRMSMAVLAAGPMMFVFPFFQRYFTKGLKAGAIKG